MGIRAICGLCCFLYLIPLTGNAAEVKPVRVDKLFKQSSSYFGEVLKQHTSATYGTKYSLSNVPISPSSMGRILKTATKFSPYAFAIEKSIELIMDAYFDGEDYIEPGQEGQDPRPPDGTVVECLNHGYLHFSESGIYTCASSRSQLIGLHVSYSTNCATIIGLSGNSFVFERVCSGSGTFTIPVTTDHNLQSTDNWYDDTEEPERVIPNSEIGQKIFDHWFDNTPPHGASSPKARWPNLPNEVSNWDVNEGFFDPPTNDWPELSGERDTFRDRLEYRDDPNYDPNNHDPNNDPELFNDRDEHKMDDVRPETNITNNYNTTNYSESGEGLTGCDLLPVVCDIYNWLTGEADPPPDEEEPEIQTELITLEDLPEVQNTLGAGSCPEPITFSAFGEQFEVSYEPFCDFAEMINPIVLASSWMVALFIITRSRG